MGDTVEGPADEDSPTRPAPLVEWRPAHERRVLDAATEDVATAVIRPGMVYGGGRGLISAFFATAESDGAADRGGGLEPLVAGLPGRVARLPAGGGGTARGIFHCTEGAGTPVIDLARAEAGRRRDGAVRTIPSGGGAGENGAGGRRAGSGSGHRVQPFRTRARLAARAPRFIDSADNVKGVARGPGDGRIDADLPTLAARSHARRKGRHSIAAPRPDGRYGIVGVVHDAVRRIGVGDVAVSGEFAQDLLVDLFGAATTPARITDVAKCEPHAVLFEAGVDDWLQRREMDHETAHCGEHLPLFLLAQRSPVPLRDLLQDDFAFLQLLSKVTVTDTSFQMYSSPWL